MADRDEEVTVKTTLPPSNQISLAEPSGPLVDPRETEAIKQGEGVRTDPESYKRMTPEQRAARKANLVLALDRGVTNDRMVVPLPAHLHGEWVRRDQMEIEAMQRLGFKVETEYGKDRGLNTDGSGAVIVHDVLFMTIPREEKELIDEVKKERAYAQSNPRGPQREEKEYANRTRTDTDGIVPPTLDSKTREVRKNDIAAAIGAVDAQTQPQTR